MSITTVVQKRPWTGRTYYQIIQDNDSLRKKWDIRNRPEKELVLYQRKQLGRIRKKVKDYENDELRKAIFRTFQRIEENYYYKAG